MNFISFPSATKQLISPLPSQISIPTRNITTNASTKASFAPLPENETLYDLLGISESGTPSEIKHAYKKMALKFHPDVSPRDRAEEYTVRFIRVQEAYKTLSDPVARSMYDSCMAKGFVFSDKREIRFDPRTDDKKRWKEMWKGQISEMQRRSTVREDQERGMSWAARIRKKRS